MGRRGSKVNPGSKRQMVARLRAEGFTRGQVMDFLGMSYQAVRNAEMIGDSPWQEVIGSQPHTTEVTDFTVHIPVKEFGLWEEVPRAWW